MKYISTDDVVYLHSRLIHYYGGLGGIKNEGQLDSVLHHIQNDELYPTIISKLTHLFFGIIMFHCFNDGNKRTAIASTWYFLENNGYKIEQFGSKLEDIAVGVAQGVITKDEVSNIFQSMFLSFGYSIK